VGALLLALGSTALLVFSNQYWSWEFLIIALLLPLTLFLVQFIVLKNELTPKSAYCLFIYTMFVLAICTKPVSWHVVVALFFILLSLRRLLSLRSGVAALRKIFDATFWMSIAAFFEPWILIFLIVIYLGILLFAPSKWRHWVMPLVALACTTSLLVIINLFFELGLWTLYPVQMAPLSVDILDRLTQIPVVPWALMVAAVIGVVIYIVKIFDIQQRVRPRYSVLVIAGLCALILTVTISFQFVLLLVPFLAIFMSRAVSTVNHKIYKELLFLFPLALFVVGLLVM
jgi:hypothetical protein